MRHGFRKASASDQAHSSETRVFLETDEEASVAESVSLRIGTGDRLWLDDPARSTVDPVSADRLAAGRTDVRGALQLLVERDPLLLPALHLALRSLDQTTSRVPG